MGPPLALPDEGAGGALPLAVGLPVGRLPVGEAGAEPLAEALGRPVGRPLPEGEAGAEPDAEALGRTERVNDGATEEDAWRSAREAAEEEGAGAPVLVLLTGLDWTSYDIRKSSYRVGPAEPLLGTGTETEGTPVGSPVGRLRDENDGKAVGKLPVNDGSPVGRAVGRVRVKLGAEEEPWRSRSAGAAKTLAMRPRTMRDFIFMMGEPERTVVS